MILGVWLTNLWGEAATVGALLLLATGFLLVSSASGTEAGSGSGSAATMFPRYLVLDSEKSDLEENMEIMIIMVG